MRSNRQNVDILFQRARTVIGEADWHGLASLLRLFLLGMGLILAVAIIGAFRFDNINPSEMAEQYRANNPLFERQIGLSILIVTIVNFSTIRFSIVPIVTFIFVILSSARFVQDVYALKTFRLALHYVITSLFALRYPILVIDRGVKQIPKNETNLIDAIGGPGIVKVQPGNAAVFRLLREPSHVSTTSNYFVRPFESVAQAINLDDQHGDRNDIPVTTRDGIRILIQDLHFRYRICLQKRGDNPVRRSFSEPYPYEQEAMRNIAFNVTVTNRGKESWNEAVERAIVGNITDFIAEHTLDFLTAPSRNSDNPRFELHNRLFYSPIQRSLRGLGAELLWVDVGHVHIVEESVDEQRADLWAAEWLGDANLARAYGDAKRSAYQELGRAEAQAEMILGITEALKNAGVEQGVSQTTIRRLLLARTAQVIDSLSTPKSTPAAHNPPKKDAA